MCGDFPLYDLVDFDNSCFKKLVGIDIKFEKSLFEYYISRKSENKSLNVQDWLEGKLLKYFNERFEILQKDFITDYKFGLNVNSLIICNKVLHFYSDDVKYKLIDRFYQSLQKDGLLYLKINHWLDPDNTDLEKVKKIGENTYQSINDPQDIRYLIVPNEFEENLKRNYQLLSAYRFEDCKTFTIVLRK